LCSLSVIAELIVLLAAVDVSTSHMEKSEMSDVDTSQPDDVSNSVGIQRLNFYVACSVGEF